MSYPTKNILRRDGTSLRIFGKTESMLTVDHVIPKAKVSADTWENLVAACVSCNNQKGDRTLP